MSKTYGILGLFETAPSVYHAAEKMRDAGFRRWDVIAPFPIHGIHHAMGLKRSKVGAFSLVGGTCGFFTGMLITWFMGAFNYPLIIGGKPYWDYVFPFPIFYELTILLAAFGAFFGMFITNGLPRHHHPVMNYENFGKLLDDKFAVVVEARDPLYDVDRTRELLNSIGATEVTLIEEK